MLSGFCLWMVLGPCAPCQAEGGERKSVVLPPGALQHLLDAEAKLWKVPGAGMVVLYPAASQTVFVTGKRALEGKDSVDELTVFPAGSLTKAFTTSLAAIAAARGQWSLDDTVHKHLDWFPESLDQARDSPVKLWHLGSHSAGLESHDLLFYRQDAPIREGVEKLLALPAPWRPGTHYQYQNLMVRTLGLAHEKRLGQKWSESVRRELLRPLAITGETFTEQAFFTQNDRAFPHRLDAGEQAAPWKDAWFCRNEDPCASLCLPLKAWEPWLRLHLGLTAAPGAGLGALETKEILETHKTRIVQPEAIQDLEFQPEFAGLGYGLGWVTLQYRGLAALAHGGVMDGYRAFILLVPERQIGVVVFANLDRSPMCHALACKVADMLLETPKVDWTGRMVKKAEREAREKKELENRVERAARAWKGAPWFREWPGVYRNAAYGGVSLQIANEGATLEFRERKYPLMRVDTSQFFLFDPILGDAQVTLSRLPKGVRLRITGRLGADFLKEE